jgi:hypothetical protein
LPKAVRKLPRPLRELWATVSNLNDDPDDIGVAPKIAWRAVRKVESAHAAKDWLQVDRQTLLAWLNGQPQGELPMPETEDKAFALQERERAVSAAFGQAFGGLAVRVYDTYLIGLVPPEREEDDGEADGEPVASGPGSLITVDDLNRSFERAMDTYWKVPYNVGTAQAGEEEVTAAVIFAPPETWTRVAPTFSELKLYDAPAGRTRWLLVSSGGFEDRDREIVSTAYLESAVDYAERSKERGPLLIWHIPGSDVGTCDYQAIVGEPGMLLESGLFDATPRGARAAAYYRQKSADTGASIRFLWANRTPDGTYLPPGMILERSLLPRANAAFPWSGLQLTAVEAKMRKPRPDAVAELAAVVGDEEAERIVAGIEANAKQLADTGVRFKEVGNVEPDEVVEVEAKAETEAVAPVEEEAKEAVVAPTEPVAETTELPAPPAFDAVFSPETLKAMAAEVAATTAAEVAKNESALLTGPLTLIAEALKNLETQIAAQNEVIAKLSKREDERVKEQVGLLPRATLKAISSTPVASRPSQRNLAVAQPEVQLSYAEIANQTLYGSETQ